MFAIAFDLTVADTERHHPKGVQQAYADIGAARLPGLTSGASRAASMSATTKISATCSTR